MPDITVKVIGVPLSRVKEAEESLRVCAKKFGEQLDMVTSYSAWETRQKIREDDPKWFLAPEWDGIGTSWPRRW